MCKIIWQTRGHSFGLRGFWEYNSRVDSIEQPGSTQTVTHRNDALNIVTDNGSTKTPFCPVLNRTD